MTDPSTRDTIRVLCVDDHEFVRDGIALKINLEPGMHVVASASTGEEAVELFRQHRPDITLMDLNLPSLSGLDAIRTIRSEDSQARIIVVTMYQGDEDVHRALLAGATTYLLKGTLSGDLVRIIRDVHAGHRPIPSDVAVQLAGRVGQTQLSPREVEVVELMAQGLRNKQIAATLGLSEETVRAHAKSIFVKLRVADRTAAVTTALRRGIIHIN